MSIAVATAEIVREPSTCDGTFGLFTLTGAKADVSPLVLHSLELPWKDNARNVSCIPVGEYDCAHMYSPRFLRRLYRVLEVPGRDGILFHSGNVAGDKSIGLRSEVEGCILLGLSVGALHGQRAVLSSAEAVRRLEGALGGREFRLRIRWKEET
jgi:hypothetical protein